MKAIPMITRTFKCYVLEKGGEILYVSTKENVNDYLDDGFIITGIVDRKFHISYNDFIKNAELVDEEG